MNPRSIIRSRQTLLGAALVATSLLVGPLLPGHASAGLTTCGTDPKVTLSNGVDVSITPTISDTASDVQGISYTVHIPAGLSATKVNYTGSWAAGLETVTVVADQPPSTYTTDTVVTTGTPSVGVAAAVHLIDSDTTTQQYAATASGQSGQDLALQIVTSMT